MTPYKLSDVKALVFDTFGTVVDYRGSIIREGNEWNKRTGRAIDWALFVDRWRGEYRPSMQKVRSGELPWTKLDDLHRASLDKLLVEFGAPDLDETEKIWLNNMWHRVMPWPDSVPALQALKDKGYITSPLGNANTRLFTDMAMHAGLPWSLILSAEMVRHYKPDPEVYLMALEYLSLKPHEVLLVAAHSYDLEAARKLGLRTAFIYRPHEYGAPELADKAKPGDFDIVTDDMRTIIAELTAAPQPKASQAQTPKRG